LIDRIKRPTLPSRSWRPQRIGIDRVFGGTHFTFVGVDFPKADGTNQRSETIMTPLGDPVELLLEPKNKSDANAISRRGVQLLPT
jgi:hypothetical protein